MARQETADSARSEFNVGMNEGHAKPSLLLSAFESWITGGAFRSFVPSESI
jgi:hypothetical protein